MCLHQNLLLVNPTKQQMQNSSLILTIAGKNKCTSCENYLTGSRSVKFSLLGTKFGILMVEGAADFLPEETMVKALQLGHTAIG